MPGFLIAAAGPETLAERCKRLEGNVAALRNRLLDAKAELLVAAEALTCHRVVDCDAAADRIHAYCEAVL
jgi:hypothetical protein